MDDYVLGYFAEEDIAEEGIVEEEDTVEGIVEDIVEEGTAVEDIVEDIAVDIVGVDIEENFAGLDIAVEGDKQEEDNCLLWFVFSGLVFH